LLEELRSSKKAIGLKQSIKALKSGTAKKLYIAKDAEDKIVKNVIELSNKNNITIVYVDSMKALGKACGISIGAAVVCIL